MQVKSGNNTQPAVFTCKLGKGVKLDAGDQVEILNGFISENGCGGNNIEFNGNFIKTANGFDEDGEETQIVKVKLEYTNLVIKHDKLLANDFQHKESVIVQNTKDATNTNSQFTVQLKDNETTIPQRYYKSNNGEGHLYLPRRFTMNNITADNPYPKPEAKAKAATNQAREFPMEVFFENIEDAAQGVNYSSINNDKTDKSKHAECDYFLYTSGGYNEAFRHDGVQPTNQFYKPRTDNKRFTMFIKSKNYNVYDTAPLNQATGKSILLEEAVINDPIASNDFIEYIELKNYKVEVGFNSPSNVAGQITEQMQQTKDYTTSDGEFRAQPERLELDVGFTGQGDAQTYEVFSATTDNSYFPIESGGMGRNDYQTRALYESATASFIADPNYTPSAAEKLAITRYMSTYQYIFIKRPEIFIAGRKLNNYLGAVNTNDTGGECKGFISNPTSIESLKQSTQNDGIMTSWEYTEKNLLLLSNLFKAEEQYTAELGIGEDRFLHMMTMPETATVKNRMGWDGYETETGTTGSFPNTAPIIFKYDKSKEDIYNDGLEGTDNLSYGFATRAVGITLENGSKMDVIVIHPELATSISAGVGGGFTLENLFLGQPVDPNNSDNNILSVNTTYIGWDWHANSYGQVIMSSMNGHSYGPATSLVDLRLNNNFTSDTDYVEGASLQANTNCEFAIMNNTPTTEANSKYNVVSQRITEYLNFRYIGANNPALVFDPTSNSFGFQYLHTAERINQPASAGRVTTVELTVGTAPNETKTTVPTSIPIDAGAKTECYKINKRLRYNDYTPDMKPYLVSYPKRLIYTSDAGTDKLPLNLSTMEHGQAFDSTVDFAPTAIAQSNQNIEEGAIFDQHCGVMLDIGATCPKRYWDKSFFGLLGFTYEQFHPNEITELNNQQIRVGEGNMFNMKYAVTNCQVVSAEIMDYPMQQWGGVNYSTQIAAPLVVQWGTTSSDTATCFGMKYKPYIVQNTQSITTRAQNIPKLMTRPYYTIRSDILDDSKYIGGLDGGLKLSLLGVVNKINGEGDYYFTDSGGMSFTITNPITITDITTAICDPDGSLSNVNDNSAVIYKITKQMNTDKFNILKQIMAQEQQPKK
tara:strand:- start:12553 stop:15846 length:3294 start_codon:yes stop_codon:yes gene_type:complete